MEDYDNDEWRPAMQPFIEGVALVLFLAMWAVLLACVVLAIEG